MSTSLAFYDFHRQSYAETLLPGRFTGGVVAEFMIGDYDDTARTLDDGGEFCVTLYNFGQNLSAHLEVFTDGYGSLFELIRIGGLAAFEKTALHSRADFSHLLLSLGLRDVSHRPLEAVA